MADETRVYSLIGYPVEHSMSPVMHNTVFRKLGLDCNYIKFSVKPEDLREFVTEKVKALEISGLNVTIPHKVKVIEYLDELSKEAETIGAVNTIKFGDKAVGYNTDGLGCIRALEEAGETVKGKKIHVFGAGGAARAIVTQAVIEGAKVSVSNREEEKQMALDLSSDVKDKLGKDVEVVDFKEQAIKEKLKEVDIVINATPVGMHPNTDQTVIPVGWIPDSATVMDIVYNPLETKLLQECREKGCNTVDGLGMLVHQGAEALKIWLDLEEVPVQEMRQAVEKELLE